MHSSSEESDNEIDSADLLCEADRKIQADIFRHFLNGTLNVNYLEKWKEYLDLPMSVLLCEDCVDEDINVLELESLCRETDIASYIETGKCNCRRQKMSYTWKLVHLVCTRKDDTSVLQYLLRTYGSSIDDVCFGEFSTSVQIACAANDSETLRLLIECGADVNKSPNDSACPLLIAIQNRHSETVDMLLECKNIDTNAITPDGQVLLAYCMLDYLEDVEKLLKAGANPNGNQKQHTYPIHRAIQLGKPHLVKCLIDCGADINSKSTRGDPTLYIAGYTGNESVVEILLNAGADPNAISPNDDNPLILIACYDGKVDMVKLLLKYGAKASLKNNLGYTALHIAAWNGHLECVKELLRAEDALNDLQTTDFNTPLALAAHGGHLEVIKEFLPLGCNVNNLDKDRDTPLHYAAYNGMTKAVELLLSNGADPDIHNACDATPLWNAVFRGKKETVKLLIKANAVMECKSVGIDQHAHSNGVVHVYDEPKSPLWVALKKNFTDIVLLLVSTGYDLYKENWLLRDEFPEGFNNQRLRTMLLEYAHTPSKLVSLCRNYFRRCFKQSLSTRVDQMDLPVSLKSYLTLADLQYMEDKTDISSNVDEDMNDEEEEDW